MPYTYHSKRGVWLTDIPDDIPANDPRVSALVERVLSTGQPGKYSWGAAGGMAVPAEPTTGADVGLMAASPRQMPQGQPQTDPAGLLGGIVRGGGPVAAGAALGAAGGSVVPGVGTAAGALAGAGITGATIAIGDPVVGAINRMFGTHYTKPSDAFNHLFTQLGVPSPDTEAERVVQAVAQGAAAAGSSIGMGSTIARAAAPVVQGLEGVGQLLPGSATASTTQRVGQALAAQPVSQIAGGMGAGGAGQAAKEMGAGPGVQLGAALAGGLVGAGAGGVAGLAGREVPAETQNLLRAGEQTGVRIMTSDVRPPQSFAGRWLQAMGEKIPYAGTGSLRATQQTQRVDAVRNVLRDFGAQDAAGLSDDVMRDLSATRAAALGKWTQAKSEVIDRLSGGQGETWYHGTAAEFPVAEMKPGAANLGVYLTKDKGYAQKYTTEAVHGPGGTPRVMEVAANPQNTLETRFGKASAAQVSKVADQMASGISPDWVASSRIQAKLDAAKAGFAGAKNPEEWKSAEAKLYDAAMDIAKARGDQTPFSVAPLREAMQTLGYDSVRKIDDGADTLVALTPSILSGAGASVVPVPAATKAIDDQIAQLQALKTSEMKPVIARLEDWKQAIQGQDLGNIELLRKQLGESFKAPELASVRSTGEKALSAIYGTIGDAEHPPSGLMADMGNYIKTAGSEADFTKWQVANRHLYDMVQELKAGSLASVLKSGEATPEVVNRLLFSSKPSDVRTLYRNLSADGQAQARGAILAKAATQAGGAENLSPDRFASEVRKLGTSVGVMFTGDDAAQVQGLVKVLNATRRAGQAALSPPTGVQNVLPVATAGLVGLFGGGLKGFAAGMATAGSFGLAMRTYESAPVRNILIALSKAPPGSPTETALFQRLYTVAQTQQASIQKAQGKE